MSSKTKNLIIGLWCFLCFLTPLAGSPAGDLRPREGNLKVGDRAPDFTLASPAGKTQFTLSAFKGKKPVVLIFGSYT